GSSPMSICPAGQSGDLVGLKLGGPSMIQLAWCRVSNGRGSPIITTTDGQNGGVVWTAGGEGSQRLYGWDAETGQVVFAGGGSGDVMAGVRGFATPIAARGRIFVGADAKLFAFAPN